MNDDQDRATEQQTCLNAKRFFIEFAKPDRPDQLTPTELIYHYENL